jgi:hypothetical protein
MTNDMTFGTDGEMYADGPELMLPVTGEVSPLVHLIEDHTTVEPGEASRAQLSVRNISSIVESYDLTVLGPAAPWVEIAPTALSLFPGDEGTAVVTFRPPQTSSVVAGEYMVGVRAMSHVTRECTAADEILVTVSPFYLFATDISRTTFAVRTKAKSQVRIINQGNSTMTYRISAVDPEDYIKVVVPIKEVTLAPGESTWIPVKGKMAPRIFGSQNDTRTIITTITPLRDAQSSAPLIGVEPVEQRINVLHKPFIRLRLGLFGRLVLLIAILALIAAFIFARVLDNTPPEATGAPPVPEAFRATLNDANQPILTWEASPGATQYAIYGVGTAGDPLPSAAPSAAAPVPAPAVASPAVAPAVSTPRNGFVIVPAVATSAPANVTPASASSAPAVPAPLSSSMADLSSLPSPVCDNCTEISTVDAGTTRFVVEQAKPGENCYRISAKVDAIQSLYSPQTCIIVPATDVLDTDGDGVADAPDANGDGIPETADTNGDGVADAAGDANGDGQMDTGAAPAAPATAPPIAPCPPVKTKARAASTDTVAILWKKAIKPPKGMTAPDPSATAAAAPAEGKDAAGAPAATDNVCDPAKEITGFTVQRQIFTGWSDVSPEGKADDTALELTGLSPDTEYCYRMRAKAADANSVWTKKFCTLTLPGIDPAPDPSATSQPTPAATASGNLVP